MKGGLFAAAAAVLATGASASNAHRHAHNLFHKKGDVCVPTCVTSIVYVTGPPTLIQPKPTPTSTVQPVTTHSAPPPPPPPATTTTVAPIITTPQVPLPTPQQQTCPTPGTYTFPATTITVDQTTTVCGASSTQVPPGTHTVGGVTTVVETQTTVTCPYATVQTSGTVTTSTVLQTTYVCPSAGTYTIAPTTTVVPSVTTITYHVPTTICPGTYTKPEQVVTVTETDYTTWCPFESSSSSTVVPVTTVAAPVTTALPTKAAAPPTSKPKSSPGSGGNALGFGNTNHLGMTYTPYQPSDGACKDASTVDKDIQAIKNAGFDVVRVYSTDCSTLENVGAACEKHGLKMILGIFVKSTGCSSSTPDIAQQIKDITAWKKWNLVDMIVAGNEAILDGLCTASELGQLLDDVKSACNGAGYSGTYTVSETLNIWQEKQVSEALCPKMDLIAANIHAFFDPNTTPDTAGKFVKNQLDMLADICPGLHPINLECGWPSGPDNDCNGSACAGKEQQAAAIKSIQETDGVDVIFFSTDNDMWKPPTDQHWGCKELFGISANL